MNNPQYQNERDYRFDPQSNAPFYPTHPQQSSSITPIPGAVLAIGIMAIVDAVFSGLATIGWFITICGIPLGIYSLVVAVMGTELEFVIMVIAVSCVKLLSAHNSTQHTSRKHKV
jgi:hypothetical protein